MQKLYILSVIYWILSSHKRSPVVSYASPSKPDNALSQNSNLILIVRLLWMIIVQELHSCREINWKQWWKVFPVDNCLHVVMLFSRIRQNVLLICIAVIEHLLKWHDNVKIRFSLTSTVILVVGSCKRQRNDFIHFHYWNHFSDVFQPKLIKFYICFEKRICL